MAWLAPVKSMTPSSKVKLRNRSLLKLLGARLGVASVAGSSKAPSNTLVLSVRLPNGKLVDT